MRTLKFRAWDGKKMYYWEFLQNLPSTWLNEDNREGAFIPMQFTGLKDKNGKEIYEGDIVRSEADDEDSAAGAVITITSEVCYGQHPKAHRVCDYLASFTLYSTGFYDEHAIFYGRRWTYEVIGNIYENPELLIPSNTSNK